MVCEVKPTKEGVTKSVANLNPYQKVEAETIAWSEGLKTAGNTKDGGVYVTNIENGDYLKVRSVDFGKGAKSIEAGVASASNGGKIEIRLDNLNGELIGTVDVKNTGGWQKWATVKSSVKKTTGVHDVYYVFTGGEGELFNFDFWKLK